MIVKMIQNLEIKMESQKNSLETRIEKMQEMFNKDWVLTLDFPGGSDGKRLPTMWETQLQSLGREDALE